MAINLFEKFQAGGWDPFVAYRVRIKVGTLVGGKPKNPDLIEAWVNASNKEKTAEHRAKIRDAHLETIGDVTDEVIEKQAIGFARVGGKLAIEGRQIKSMLKEAANILNKRPLEAKDPKKKSGPLTITSFRSKMADQVFVSEEWIQIDRSEPDGIEDRPIHVMTAQGPRDSIKRCEYVTDVEIEFTIRRLKEGGAGKMGVPERALLAVLTYAQSIGLGADRSQGRGTFQVLSVEQIDG